jgi:hypothetical protein
VIACSNAAGEFLPSVLIFKDVNKEQEFGDGLPSGSCVYMKGNRRTDFFTKWFTELYLKHNISGKNILLLDGHRSQCSSHLLLQTAVKMTLLSFAH